jgi:hypothetical protein
MKLRCARSVSSRQPTSLFMAVALLCGQVVHAADTKTPAPAMIPASPSSVVTGPSTNIDAFRIITERNIFDPNRTGRIVRGSDNQPQNDTISLVGTMHYEKGLFAFFDGSGPSFKKSLREGETIAQYTVAHIRNEGVELTRDGRQFFLTIGQQLRRPVGGDWTAIGLDTLRSESDPARVADTTAPSASPPGASDTLKRLMEQRQKQLRP